MKNTMVWLWALLSTLSSQSAAMTMNEYLGDKTKLCC